MRPSFIASAHLTETLTKVEHAVDLTLDEVSRSRNAGEDKLMFGISG